jgi:hypothetical protein
VSVGPNRRWQLVSAGAYREQMVLGPFTSRGGHGNIADRRLNVLSGLPLMQTMRTLPAGSSNQEPARWHSELPRAAEIAQQFDAGPASAHKCRRPDSCYRIRSGLTGTPQAQASSDQSAPASHCVGWAPRRPGMSGAGAGGGAAEALVPGEGGKHGLFGVGRCVQRRGWRAARLHAGTGFAAKGSPRSRDAARPRLPPRAASSASAWSTS